MLPSNGRKGYLIFILLIITLTLSLFNVFSKLFADVLFKRLGAENGSNVFSLILFKTVSVFLIARGKTIYTSLCNRFLLFVWMVSCSVPVYIAGGLN